MDKLLALFLSVCCLALATASDLNIHDFDVQIHPIQSHHGHYGDHQGYATSVRYDKRYHHKTLHAVPEYHQDVVYQYVSDGDDHEVELDGGHYHGY